MLVAGCTYFQYVSILVLLDVILKENSGFDNRIFAESFNPCFVGCYSESRHHNNQSVPHFHVSILVLLDVILKDKSQIPVMKSFFVSILVLLDVILKE